MTRALAWLPLSLLVGCGPGGLRDLQDLQVSITGGEYLDGSGRVRVSLFYDQAQSGCLVGGGIRVTLNGRALAVQQGRRGMGFYDAGQCQQPWAEGLPDATDLEAPLTVIEAADGAATVKVQVEQFFAPWSFSVTEPAGGVLQPGADAVVTWTPASRALADAICMDACPVLVSFAYDSGAASWSHDAATVTASGNTLRFQVPASAPTGSGTLRLGPTLLRPRVTECTGATDCSASLVREFAETTVAASVGP